MSYTTSAIICFAMALINVMFIIDDPSGATFDWFSAGLCTGIGVSQFLHGLKDKDVNE